MVISLSESARRLYHHKAMFLTLRPVHSCLAVFTLSLAVLQASCGGADEPGDAGAGGGSSVPSASGGGTSAPSSGGSMSVALPADNRKLSELTDEEGTAFCLSLATPDAIFGRCDVLAMLTAREGSEPDYLAECKRLRDDCVASRDDGNVDLECQNFSRAFGETCLATIGELKSCTAAIPAPETRPGCTLSYSEARAYVVGPPPDTSVLPECDSLNACYSGQ